MTTASPLIVGQNSRSSILVGLPEDPIDNRPQAERSTLLGRAHALLAGSLAYLKAGARCAARRTAICI
jgi:hypothetical protein